MTRSLPVTMTLLLVLSVSLCLLVSPRATEPDGNPTEGPAARNVDRLLKDLGSDQFETREAATRALEALEEEPIGLRERLKSPDLEVRRRVDLILKSHVTKRARRGLAKALALAKEGRFEEMVERLIFWKDWDQGKEGDKALAELAARTFEWEQRHFANLESMWPNFKLGTQRSKPRSQRKKYSLKELREPPSVEDVAEIWTEYKKVRSRNIIATGEHGAPNANTVYIASGDVCVPSLQNGFIFAGGNVEVYRAHNTVIFCAGDFKNNCKGKSWLTSCLIIANGEVTCSSDVMGCTILTGRSFLLPKGAKIDYSAILKTNTPQSFVKFFAPETMGLTVLQSYRDNKIVDVWGIPFTGEGVWIKEVRADSPFAAGLRAEDVITALDEIKVRTTERFRKVLCRKLAEGGPRITFTIHRKGKTLDVPIAVKD